MTRIAVLDQPSRFSWQWSLDGRCDYMYSMYNSTKPQLREKHHVDRSLISRPPAASARCFVEHVCAREARRCAREAPRADDPDADGKTVAHESAPGAQRCEAA